MTAKNHNQPQQAVPRAKLNVPRRGRTDSKTSPTKSSFSHQRVTLDDLRNSRERVRLQTLQKKIALAPPLDRHPPEKLSDFLPTWFEKTVLKSGESLATATETLQATLPAQLWRNIALGPLQRGVLTLYCTSSTAKMELDMLLRAGTPGLRHLQINTKGLIFKVKTIVDRAGVSR